MAPLRESLKSVYMLGVDAEGVPNQSDWKHYPLGRMIQVDQMQRLVFATLQLWPRASALYLTQYLSGEKPLDEYVAVAEFDLVEGLDVVELINFRGENTFLQGTYDEHRDPPTPHVLHIYL